MYLLVRQINKSKNHAEKSLQIDPANAFAYYVLGIADLWEGKLEDALSAAEKMLTINPGFPAAYMLKSDVLIAKLGKQVADGSTVKDEIDLLRQSVDVLETGVRNSRQSADLKAIEEKLEAIKAFFTYYNKDSVVKPAVPASPEPGVTPVKILRKPQARYTESARAAGKSGTVRLAVLLGANGKIQHILKLWEIGYGLDEQAVRAAGKIEFEPQMRDGKPVSSVVIIEYSFSIY